MGTRFALVLSDPRLSCRAGGCDELSSQLTGGAGPAESAGVSFVLFLGLGICTSCCLFLRTTSGRGPWDDVSLQPSVLTCCCLAARSPAGQDQHLHDSLMDHRAALASFHHLLFPPDPWVLLQLGYIPQSPGVLFGDVIIPLKTSLANGVLLFSPSPSWVTTAPPTWKTTLLLAKLRSSGPFRVRSFMLWLSQRCLLTMMSMVGDVS